MIAVIFEVILVPGREAEYLDIAAKLLVQLETIEGFLSIERFRSMKNPDKMLALSYWKDEQAVATWRTAEDHRAAQERGRSSIFQDYRIRIATVIRDYGMHERGEAPKDS